MTPITFLEVSQSFYMNLGSAQIIQEDRVEILPIFHEVAQLLDAPQIFVRGSRSRIRPFFDFGAKCGAPAGDTFLVLSPD